MLKSVPTNFHFVFQDIITGSAQVSLAGGTENMSAVPFLVRNARFGIPLGVKIPFEDSLTAASLDTFCNFTMPQTAENLAEKYELKRGEVDQFALQSQQRWKAGKSSASEDLNKVGTCDVTDSYQPTWDQTVAPNANENRWVCQ